MRRVLAVLAHPDDEVLGCGGTLAKHTAAGDCIAVQWFTDGVGSRGGSLSVRWAEALAALRALGLRPDADDVSLRPAPKYADQMLDQASLLQLARDITEHIESFYPDVIYTHWPGDLNQDHRRVAEAVLVATRLVAGSKVRRVLACEIPESTSQAFGGPAFAPSVFIALERAHVDAKLAALECYASERRERPHLRNRVAVEARTEYWGGVSGVHNAEAFVLLREVWR